jgi:hypothetical protein
MKRTFLSGVLAVMMTALVGSAATVVAAEPSSRLWSVVVHFEYADGTAYDYVLATGVTTREMSAYLADCGRSHRTGSVVRYHCYPVAE